MKTVLITGGSGLIGTAVGQALVVRGYRVIILTRDAAGKKPAGNISFAEWDVADQQIDTHAIATADYIIHLAGAGVADKRWTQKRKAEIVQSRVSSSKLIADSLARIPNKVKAVVSASAIGWYGPDPVIPNPHPFTEDDPADPSFLGTTCKQWEESIDPVQQAGIRLVKLRTGIVISKDGGALKEFKKPLRFALAAILGSGKQVLSWIHIDDLAAMYIAAIENENIKGVYNAVAPSPVSNRMFTLYLAGKNKFYIPVHIPSFVLRLALGEMSIEVLKSATVSAGKIEGTGFVFRYPGFREALDEASR